MKTLTQAQILRQDFVDNQIFELLNSLLPQLKQLEWDIEIIGKVRDYIRIELVQKSKIINEADFYPFIK